MFRFQEDFLHLVWKYQYFDKKQLETTCGQALAVTKIGYHNHHEGPDFNEAQVTLGNVNCHGHVEIHLSASDWKLHKHHLDENYNSVILHVVWEADHEAKRKDGTIIPTLELKGRVYLEVVRNYERLLTSPKKILCGEVLKDVPDILKFSMLEKSLVERLHEKSGMVIQLLRENKDDWEETAYQWLFYSFGFKTNSLAMLKLSKSLPYITIKKNAGNILALEALIFGQSGLLPNVLNLEKGYLQKLGDEYEYLKKKYGLKQTIYASEWKFMRVRPSNFPTIRLAQVAAILNQSPNIFSTVLYELEHHHRFGQIFNQKVSAYWQQHYHFGKPNTRNFAGNPSSNVLSLLAINFVVPLWYAYGKYADLGEWQEKCFNFLQEIEAEQNSIITLFEKENWKSAQAFDSQGMLGLYKNYCSKRKCLDCKIGQNLLRPSLH